jgi:hypothetical protein
MLRSTGEYFYHLFYPCEHQPSQYGSTLLVKRLKHDGKQPALINNNYLQEEQTVAKRRNLKKEKAERNRAYARQFRSASRTQNRRYGGRQQNSSSSGSSSNGAASDE